MSLIHKEIAKQIKQSTTNYYPKAEEIVNSQKDHQFFLEKDHLVVYFQPYEIAPFYEGFTEFRIPYNTLRNELQPKYRATFLKN